VRSAGLHLDDYEWPPTMTESQARVDDSGRAYAGSQLQIQIYVNRRLDELSRHVLRALPSVASRGAHIRWVSPLESDRFTEYQDQAFLRAVGLEHLAVALRTFWPRGGPVWDALAVVETARTPGWRGVLLVEAKSHVREVYGGGCKASERSRKAIEAALELTKRWLGASPDSDWTGALYQSANRLAHLYFFREVAKVPAWLVNIYFFDDPHSPTSREEWKVALGQVKGELALTGVAIPHTAELFLRAGDRRESLDA
jgi:hypothetical protein